jgi:hypothetical protein
VYVERKDPYSLTDEKENEIFLIYKEIQMGSGAKSYMRKGLLIYEEMRKYLTTYEADAVYDFATDPV